MDLVDRMSLTFICLLYIFFNSSKIVFFIVIDKYLETHKAINWFLLIS